MHAVCSWPTVHEEGAADVPGRPPPVFQVSVLKWTARGRQPQNWFSPFKRFKLDAVFIPVLDFGGDGPEAVFSDHSEVAHNGLRRAGV